MQSGTQTNFSFFYIYLLALWGSEKGEGGRKGRVCPSLEYKFNSDNNRFLPRFRLKSISGYVSVRENLYLFFFVLRSSILDEDGLGGWGMGRGGGMAASFNGRRIRSCPTWVCVWVRQGRSMRTGVRGRETERHSHSGCYFTLPTVVATWVFDSISDGKGGHLQLTVLLQNPLRKNKGF